MLTLIRQFFAAPDREAALPTYIALVAQARNPFFYDALAVPDTLDGRFELIVLHLFLLQHRLTQATLSETDLERTGRASHEPATRRAGLISRPTRSNPISEDFARSLSELFFADMDRSVRELGVADTGVRYRIKAMAKAYHGRLQAYTVSLRDGEALRAALARNLYGTVAQGDPATLTTMAEYVQRTAAALQAMPMETILAGTWAWPLPTADSAAGAATTPPLRQRA